MVRYRQIMNFYAFNYFFPERFFIAACDHRYLMAFRKQRLCQIVRPERSAFFRSVKMLMKDQNFHDAKQRKSTIVSSDRQYFLGSCKNKNRCVLSVETTAIFMAHKILESQMFYMMSWSSMDVFPEGSSNSSIC